jgi:hypothetical protein
MEVTATGPTQIPSTVGQAMYELYENLAASLTSGAELYSPATSALKTARVIDRILEPRTEGTT